MTKPPLWLAKRQTRKGRDVLFREHLAERSRNARRFTAPAAAGPAQRPRSWWPDRYLPHEPIRLVDFSSWSTGSVTTWSTGSVTTWHNNTWDTTSTGNSSTVEWAVTTTADAYRMARMLDEWPRERGRGALHHLERDAERQAQYRREAEEAQRRRAEASVRATALLVRFLDDEQRAEWEANRQIYVVSQLGRLYCIQRGRQHNVFLVAPRSHSQLLELCVHVSDGVPHEDNVLAQKLWLETDELEFLRRANIWDHTQGRIQVSTSGYAFDPTMCTPAVRTALAPQGAPDGRGLIVVA